MADYQKYGIEFVLNENISYPTARRNKENGKWELNLPTKYEYEIYGMISRCFDDILKVDFEALQNRLRGQKMENPEDEAKKATKDMIERRIEIAARVYYANMMLGETYGGNFEGYELAEEYRKYYQDGIREAFEKGSVNQDTLKDELIRRGKDHAREQLLRSIDETKDGILIFPSMQPGAYFEEFNTKKERTIGHKTKPTTFRAEKPIKVGTTEFVELMNQLDTRRKKDENSILNANIEINKNYALNAIIMPDKTIWALPVYFSDGVLSQHSIVAKGKPCAWAGEVTIKNNEVVEIRDQSGHYRTMDFSEEGQKALSDFTLQAFKEKRYTVPEKVELAKKRRV